MASKKQKSSRRKFRQQRWAAIVAGVVALGMLVSSIIYYLDYITGRAQNPAGDWKMEDYLEYYRDQAEHYENFIEEHGPTVAVLEALAGCYYNLLAFGQILPDASVDQAELKQKLVAVYLDLIELAPDELGYHINLLYAYQTAEADEETIQERVALLAGLLRESPRAEVHLQLINFLSQEEMKEQQEEEITWLRAYLDQRIADEEADNMDRYYLAILAAEHQDDKETALAQLDHILETEEEESSLYSQAQQYRDRLTEKEEKPEEKQKEKPEEKPAGEKAEDKSD